MQPRSRQQLVHASGTFSPDGWLACDRPGTQGSAPSGGDGPCYEIEVEGISEPVEPAPGVGSAHIHFLATGGIAVDLETDFQPDKSDEFKASGCVEVDSTLLQAILENPDQFYVNIHNVEFPGGALAGLLSG
jgi:hypothetical protein